jgi:hypothetical protein
MRAMRGAAEWKPKPRCERGSDLGVQALEAGVGESEGDGGEDAVAVAAQRVRQADERLELGARRPGQPGLEVFGRLGGVVEVVERS